MALDGSQQHKSRPKKKSLLQPLGASSNDALSSMNA